MKGESLLAGIKARRWLCQVEASETTTLTGSKASCWASQNDIGLFEGYMRLIRSVLAEDVPAKLGSKPSDGFKAHVPHKRRQDSVDIATADRPASLAFATDGESSRARLRADVAAFTAAAVVVMFFSNGEQ